MKRSWLNRPITKLLLAGFFLLGSVMVPQADQANYLYDELGRLVGAADGQGNMAVYTYDSAGNLLSIQKYSSSTTGIGIYLLMPSKGTVGTQVQIQGYGFSVTPANNQISFNGTMATVISSTPYSIITIVPPNAISGPVTVTNSNGTATSSTPFTVLQVPVISAINPNMVAQGSTNYNTIISGFNLTGATSVSFSQGGISATILSGGTATQLPVSLVVAANVPSGSYPFSVTTTVGTSQSGTVTVTVKPPSPDSSTARPLSVFMPSSGQVQPTGPESASASSLSVFLPPLANQTPSGSESTGALPLSVFLPPAINQAPSGPESANALSLSIYLPSSATVSPSGSLMVVAPPDSVSMP